MRTYKKLYGKLCSLENLELAFRKARKRKSKKFYVIEFENNLQQNLKALNQELESLTYKPKPLNKFIIRDPKTRTIHSSNFRDRIIHHASINILEPIYEKIFIYDSYASRLNKGTHKALLRFDYFKRKVSKNGRLIKNSSNNNHVIGYCLKADIKHYFETVDHEILISIIKRKVKDEKVIWLIKQILNNFNSKIKGRGMPLGNLTSQFFANVYLNELDYFIKHNFKAKYYIRYVDDFIILHSSKEQLIKWKEQINSFLKDKLKLELHPDKSKIIALKNGISLVGYKTFYYHKLLKKSNIKKFEYNLNEKLDLYKRGLSSYDELIKSIQGWLGYAVWANTYKSRKDIIGKVNSFSNDRNINHNPYIIHF